MAATTLAIYISSDNVIQLDALYDNIDASYLNAATVSVTIKDVGGSEVSGVSWPCTMTYVSSSNGRYRTTIDAALAITEGNIYFAEITAAESGKDFFSRTPMLAQYRT